jgi:hypothetical protein
MGVVARLGRVVEPESGRIVFETPELLAEEDLWTDDGAEDHAGWHCVSTNPFPCPADGCGFVAEFMTAAHLILVWEERDDPNLLRHAERAKKVGRNPHVVEYEPGFGPSASYYAWEAAGRPVHGIRKK